MMKRSLCLLLVTVLLLAVLSGCGGDSKTKGAAEGSKSGPVGQSIDTLVMMKYLDTTQFLNDSPAVDAVKEVLREKLYIDVVLMDNPTNDIEWFDTKIAGGEQIDVFVSYGWPKYKEQEAILPLNDLLDKYGLDILKNADPTSMKICSDSEGTVWAVPWEMFNMYLVMIVRGDWMEKYNIDTPVTVDDWEAMMKTFKDEEGDIGILQHWSGVYDGVFSPSFIPCAGGYQRYLDDNGKLQFGFTHPGYKDYLAFMRDWYRKGYIVKEYLTMPTPQIEEAFKQGEAGVLAGWYSIGYEWEEEMRQADPEVKVTHLLPPSATYQGRFFHEKPVYRSVGVMSQTKIPEKCMQFLNYNMATPEGIMLTRYGVEGLSYNKYDDGIELLKDDNDMYLYFYPLTTGNMLRLFKDLPTMREESYVKIGALENWLMSDEVPKVDRPDLTVSYDTEAMESRDLMNTLKTFFDEETAKIITGEADIDDWDGIVQRWYQMGGRQLIDDYNRQYAAAQ